jgi:hypothetical protein
MSCLCDNDIPAPQECVNLALDGVHIPHIFQCLRLFAFQYFARLKSPIATGCTQCRPLQHPRITVLAQLPRHSFAMFANYHLQEIENKDVASKLVRLPDPARR